MKKLSFTSFLILACFFTVHAANTRVVVDSLKIDSGYLVMDFEVEGIITDKAEQGLSRGLTSTIEYQIQLWEDKSGWINRLVTETDFKIKVFFDNWEQKYIILTHNEKRLTNSLETVREKCSQLKNIVVCPFEKLLPGKNYYITVKTILRPLSIENYKEIRNWLSGEAKQLNFENLDDTEKQEEKFKGGLLKMVLALTGFGDRAISGKSKNFRIEQSEIKWTE